MTSKNCMTVTSIVTRYNLAVPYCVILRQISRLDVYDTAN